MVTSELGACEWFVWDLRRSGLIDRGQLDQVVGEFMTRSPRAEPPALAEFLVGQKVLSAFQAERILQGKTQGLVLGPYILVDAIGAGSMGQVYKAQSKTDSQWYAVKVLPRRSMWNVRLARRQVRAFAQFSHPAVVPFVDVGTAGGQHYLVWPLVDGGETLEARVQRDGPLPTDQTGALMSQVAAGLAAAHGQGLFHGLLKPSNILIGPDGHAKLLDFGIGSLLAENEGESLVDTMSTANTLTSGLDCASPESIMEPTNRTQAGDQYSFGCVLYYCLAGRYPFGEGTAVEKMMAHQFKQASPLREFAPRAPEAVVTIIDRLMQKSPDGRFAGMDEVVEALHPFASEGGRRGGGGTTHVGIQQRGAISVAGNDPVPAPPPRHEPVVVPSGGSKFDSGPPRSAHPTSAPPRSAPVAATQFSTPVVGADTPVPSKSRFGSSVPAAPEPARPQVPALRTQAPPVARHAPPMPPTPAPAPPPAPPARSAPPPAPSRASFRSQPEPSTAPPPRAVPMMPSSAFDDESIPEALPVDDDFVPSPKSRVPSLGAAGSYNEPKKAGGVSVLLVFLITLIVTTGVYLLGKNFLFD